MKISNARVRRSLIASVFEGMTTEIFGSCIERLLITGWAYYLNIGPFYIGIIGAIPFFLQLLHLIAAFFTYMVGKRKLALITITLRRLSYLPLILLALDQISNSSKIATFLAVIIVADILGVFGNNAWTTWMSELVPQALRGKYFGVRTAIVTFIRLCSVYIIGIYLDQGRTANKLGTVLLVLIGVGVFIGLLGSIFLSLQHDFEDNLAPSFDLQKILSPFKEKSSRNIFYYRMIAFLSIGLVTPFYSIYMLKTLGISYRSIALQSTCYDIMQIISVAFWGYALDKQGIKRITLWTTFGGAIIPVLWLFPNQTCHWPIYLIAICYGLVNSGFELSNFSLSISSSEKEERAFYLAAYSTAEGVAYAVASVFAGFIIKILPDTMMIFHLNFTSMHLLFIVSSLIGFYATYLGKGISLS